MGNIHGGEHAGRIAGVDAGFFNVLHDSADDHVVAVGERVNINFDRVFKEVVDEHGAVLRIFDGFFHVADDGFFVVGDDHGASAKHIRRTHENGIADFGGSGDRKSTRLNSSHT